jgi:hypothetical protein
VNTRNIIWLPSVKNKLTQYRSENFSPEETLDFISHIILETEDLLKNPVLSKAYTEEFGEYKGVSRIVVRNFRIYFESYGNDIAIVAILFPGKK